MTIQELIGRAQAALRAMETAKETLDEVLEAINLEANGFEVREITVAEAFTLLQSSRADAFNMKHNGYPVRNIHEAGSLHYRVYYYDSEENSEVEWDNEAADSKCITIVVEKKEQAT